MLKEEKKNPSQNENKNQNDQSSERDSSQNIDEQFLSNLSHDYQEQNNNNLYPGELLTDDFDQLVDVFYELVTLVNKHSKLINSNNSIPNMSTNNQSLLTQNIGLNRIFSKRKSSKPSRIVSDPAKTIRDTEKTKISQKRQHLQNYKQTFSETNKKSTTVLIDNKNNAESKNDDIYANAMKKNIFRNYSEIMEYHIHFSDDDPQPSPNLLGSSKIKARNPERSVSQYSFAHSSKNVQQKQKRKFSLSRAVSIVVEPKTINLQIYPQFQIKQDNRNVTIINYTNDSQSKD